MEKSNFVIFHSPQKKLQSHYFYLAINNKQLKREFCIKYLGILIDSNLNWKDQEIPIRPLFSQFLFYRKKQYE